MRLPKIKNEEGLLPSGRGRMSEETDCTEFENGLRPSGRKAYPRADGWKETGQVLRLWIREVSGQKARVFLDCGYDDKGALLLRANVINVARATATKNGCEAFGIFDSETGRLLAFEKAAHVEVQWAARYEHERGRDADKRKGYGEVS